MSILEPTEYAERWADRYDEWFSWLTDTDLVFSRRNCLNVSADIIPGQGLFRAVQTLKKLLRLNTSGGHAGRPGRRRPVLELGVGTGRLAIPLARRGLSVHGVEASERMIKLLRAKEGGSLVDITVGDFAVFDLKERFSLIFLSCNTLFSLPLQEQQTSCMQHAARHLKNGGVVVVEASVPDVASYTDGSLLRAILVDCDSLILMAVGHDSVSQQAIMQQVILTESGSNLVRSGIATSGLPSLTSWPACPVSGLSL